MGNGETTLATAPAPSSKSGHGLIETHCSLISAGTERMLVNFGQGNLISKARQQPEKVKMVLEKVQTDGLLSTFDAVKSKLDQPLPLGYCNVGHLVELGSDMNGFKLGDRVVSNGPHADIVRVPKNLCAKIPDNVDDDSAVFTVLASIGLQGIRLAQPTMGEHFVVIGAGLIGLCAIQLLKANGCKVLAVDFDQNKLALAQQFGAEICNPAKGEDPVAMSLAFTTNAGVDAVLITASTPSSDPVSQAANMCRQRGRIILVGVTGLELNRSEFYEKELSFQVSCSYGPGRYDAEYEERGHDYPIGFVRWTEQRNFEAILTLLSEGQLDFKPLISHRYAFDDAPTAYKTLTDDKQALGIILEYPTEGSENKLIKNIKLDSNRQFESKKVILGVIGAGNYASRILIPAFKQAGALLHSIASSGGINSAIHGEKNGFSEALTDTQAMLCNSEINTIAVVSQHNTHAKFVAEALEKGKNVFVEKPLAINFDQLEAVQTCYQNTLDDPKNKARLMLGFNRRFSPQVQIIKSLLAPIKEPKSFIMTINAGAIPKDHWTQDLAVGGGRIIGEACHFIDLMRFLAASPISSVECTRMGDNSSTDVTEDKASITLRFEDGSFGTIHYLANGSGNFPKERIEIFCSGGVLQLDNFRKLKGFGWKGFRKMNLWQQDKGHKACAKAFIDSIELGQSSPIPAEEIFEVASVSIKAAELLRAQR